MVLPSWYKNFTRLLLLLCVALPAVAGTLNGSVRNGTSGAVVAGQTVVLIRLAGGMEEIDTAKTDTQGRFTFDRAEIGQQPFLVRVNYRGVNYHASAPPTQTSVQVDVFEPTAKAADVHLTSRAVIVQPNGATLLVGEEYELTNVAKPSATFIKEFEFAIPEGAEISQVSAAGPSGMPVVQGTINKGNNRFGVAYPLRPGQNMIRFSYQLPYSTQQARIGAASPYAAEAVMVMAPPTMQISGPGLQAAGQREGWNVFARNNVVAGEALDISVSGTAPPPAPDGSSSGSGTAPAAASGAEVRTLPARIDDLKWILVAGFSALFFLGAMYLWRRPVTVLPAGVAAASPAVLAAPVPVSAAVVQAEQHVKQGLDELKDALFRLELRHQAGTISEEEYARERGRTEQILRALVRG